jgi:hypothetical protein
MPEEHQGDGGLADTGHGLVAAGVVAGRTELFGFRSPLAGLILSAWDEVLGDE